MGRTGDRYDLYLSNEDGSYGRNSGGPIAMELSARGTGGVPPITAARAARDSERRLAVLALLVIVLVAGLGTLGAVFSGFTFI